MITTVQVRNALRAERQRAGMTLDAVAAKTGLNRATLHSIENVKREPNLRPEFESVVRIVDSLGVSLSDFFRRIETPADENVPTVENGDPVVLAIERLTHTVEEGFDRVIEAFQASDDRPTGVHRFQPPTRRAQ